MHIEALRARAEAFARTGRHREALQDALACMGLSASASIEMFLFCGQQKIALGDFEGSLKDANRAVGGAAGPEEIAASLRFRSRVLSRLGRTQAAEADAERLKRLLEARPET